MRQINKTWLNYYKEYDNESSEYDIIQKKL